MYITTFYSFKGGVGRTLALANVALELAQTGRRVLLVDFDLEAPGIHTFDTLKTTSPHPGVVEYVTDYLETNRAPDARGYSYEVPGVGRQDGQLWVMPAGRGDQTYRAKLARINWQTLYRDRDGFLLIEDLKEQWRKLYNPHYVFIDSRTGHTDVEGICTRQLPDAVVILFFPNEQNLAGLREVVGDIRAEVRGERKKDIRLHFVMSNVPDLDDEEEILIRRMEEFEKALGYDSLTATIHRYESLALLNQMIFTQSRPKSRLAMEYREVKDAIVTGNIEDIEGAIRFIKGGFRPGGAYYSDLPRDKFEDRIRNIREKHPNDANLPFLIAMVWKEEKRFEEALALLDEAVEKGNRSGEVLLARADLYEELENRQAAVTDLKEALKLATLDASQIVRAAHMLRSLDGSSLRLIPQCPSLKLLPNDFLVAVSVTLQWSLTGLAAALEILTTLIDTPKLSVLERTSIFNRKVLSLIGLSRFDDALQLITETNPCPDDYPIETAFNFAIAEWGKFGQPQRSSFEHVAEFAKKNPELIPGANYRQCLAVCYWAIGEKELALQRIEQAESWMNRHKTPDFSCWRYLVTPQKDFLEDCATIRKLIAGQEVRPLFFSSGGGQNANS